MKKQLRTFLKSILLVGMVLVFTTSCNKSDDPDDSTPDGTVKDMDGNVYHTVTIGTQVWMVENLKVTKFNDGTAIPIVTDNAAWAQLTSSAYCWYENDEASNKSTYGAMYNGYAVHSGKLCPVGWHVPTKDEWTTLITFLGDDVSKLKEAGISHWQTAGATNESGFTALPGGMRFNSGSFANRGLVGEWWSSTTVNGEGTWSIFLFDMEGAGVGSGTGDGVPGYSVRCIKN